MPTGRRGGSGRALCVALALLSNASDAYHPTIAGLSTARRAGTASHGRTGNGGAAAAAAAGMPRRARTVLAGASQAGDDSEDPRKAIIDAEMRAEG